jgi:hypothetical protein
MLWIFPEMAQSFGAQALGREGHVLFKFLCASQQQVRSVAPQVNAKDNVHPVLAINRDPLPYHWKLERKPGRK